MPAEHRQVLLALSWYYPEIHRGVVEYARRHHWHVTADLDDPVPRHWAGDGVLTHLGRRTEIWTRLERLDVPIVDLTESHPEIPLPRVTMDNAAIGRMAARFFLNRGYRRCGMVHRWELGVSRGRRQAFLAELDQAHATCRTLCLHEKLGSHVDDRTRRHEVLASWLKSLRYPVGILASRDDEAVEVIDACFALGLHVPEQVSVLGVDNTDTICDCLRVPLSSVDTNLETVGYEGARLLDELMSGNPPHDGPVYIAPGGIVERRSTDSMAIAHDKVAQALRYIRDHHAEPIDVPRVARAVAMSRSGLEKAFREHFVRAPGEELRRIRLEHVQRRLRTSADTLDAIALQTGFQSAQHLCRAFRREFGTTPKRYRLQEGP